MTTIKFVADGGFELHFQVRNDTKADIMMLNFAKKLGKPLNALKFFFNGNQIKDSDTVGELKLENNDVVEVAVRHSAQEPGNDGSITLKVVQQSGVEIHYKVRPSTKLGGLMRSFAKRVGGVQHEMKFFFDSLRLQENDTVESVGLMDSDVIEVYQGQAGGNDSDGLIARNQSHHRKH